jgi:hypothetical protein
MLFTSIDFRTFQDNSRNMVDFANEIPVKLSDAARRFNVSTRTMHNWIRGIGTPQGRVLETAEVGGMIYTSLQAIQRFSTQRTIERGRSTRVPSLDGSTNNGVIQNGAGSLCNAIG